MEIYNKEFLKFDTHEHMSKKKLGGGHRHYGTGCGSLYGTCPEHQSKPSMGGNHEHYGTGCGSLYGTCPEHQSKPIVWVEIMNTTVQVVEVFMELVQNNKLT